MISIIVSSYNKTFFDNFKSNVAQTIGSIPYEIIQVYNPGLIGISQAYNEGATMAKYPYFVFSHEDILIHTKNWGNCIIKVFEQRPDVGLIGCAGGFYKSLLRAGWAVNNSCYVSSFMIGTHYGKSCFSRTHGGVSRSVEFEDYKINNLDYFRNQATVNEEVLMLDGMFLCTKKSIHEKFPFDHTIFKGFHAYDLDFSLQIGRRYKVIVNHNILIEHFSPGNLNLEWLKEMKKLNEKWQEELPKCLYKLSGYQLSKLELGCVEQMVRIYRFNKLPTFDAIKPVFKSYYITKLGIVNWCLLIFQLFAKTFIFSFSNLCKSIKVLKS